MPEIKINCVDCKAAFFFSEYLQNKYREQGFQAPRRCRACREKRKTDREQAVKK